MSSQKHEQLLRQASEAAREGNRSAARKLIEQVLEEDDENVKAWMWLYRISDDLDEKRIALTNVVQLEPTNARAKEALEKLEGRARRSGDDEEVAPGITRRQLLLFGGGALLVIVVVLGGALLLISSNNQQRANDEATARAIVELPTRQEQTRVAEIAQGTADAQATLDTLLLTATATPTQTNTPEFARTLPPEFTATPTPTPPVTATPLPPPVGLGGVIFGWGGSDILNDGYYEILQLPVSSPGQIIEIGEGRGLNTTAGGNLVAYTRYFRDVFTEEIVIFDPRESATPRLLTQFLQGQTGLPGRSTQARFSRDGTKMVFIGTAPSNNTREVYLYDFPSNTLTRLTDDPNNYAFPAIRPDGTQVVAVLETPPLHDLLIIDVASRTATALTTDGMLTRETHPRFSPDGSFVVYAATNDTLNGNHNIFFRTSDGFGDPIPVTRDTDADNIFPVFSPDGLYMAFASNRRNGDYSIYIYNLQNGELNQLVDADGDFFPGAWLP